MDTTTTTTTDTWTALALAAAAESSASAIESAPTEPPPAVIAPAAAPSAPAYRATLIRPGLMVSLKSTVRGGVSYKRVDLDAADPAAVTVADAEAGQMIEESKADVRRWETTKIVDDPAEMAAATKARSKALSVIRALCSRTSFGLLCPSNIEVTLDAAIAEAQAIVAAHNATASTTHAAIFVLKGRVASDDLQAVKAISQEVRELVNDMATGIQKLDAKAVREAADAAKQMIDLLEEEQAIKVADAVVQARKAARTIVARIEKSGEDAAIVLQDIQRGAIEKCRAAFLDFDDAAPVGGEALPSVDVRRAASLDLGDDSKAVA